MDAPIEQLRMSRLSQIVELTPELAQLKNARQSFLDAKRENTNLAKSIAETIAKKIIEERCLDVLSKDGYLSANIKFDQAYTSAVRSNVDISLENSSEIPFSLVEEIKSILECIVSSVRTMDSQKNGLFIAGFNILVSDCRERWTLDQHGKMSDNSSNRNIMLHGVDNIYGAAIRQAEEKYLKYTGNRPEAMERVNELFKDSLSWKSVVELYGQGQPVTYRLIFNKIIAEGIAPKIVGAGVTEYIRDIILADIVYFLDEVSNRLQTTPHCLYIIGTWGCQNQSQFKSTIEAIKSENVPLMADFIIS